MKIEKLLILVRSIINKNLKKIDSSINSGFINFYLGKVLTTNFYLFSDVTLIIKFWEEIRENNEITSIVLNSTNEFLLKCKDESINLSKEEIAKLIEEIHTSNSSQQSVIDDTMRNELVSSNIFIGKDDNGKSTYMKYHQFLIANSWFMFLILMKYSFNNLVFKEIDGNLFLVSIE